MNQRRSRPARSSPAAGSGHVRIIGGQWRGTRLAVPDAEGLRPTPDRVRETLFNWLAPALPGARVLDLFAGSGALGLEAVSRGASAATLVERDRGLAQGLRSVVQRLGASGAVAVVEADATRWAQARPGGGYDVAFVDPPFAAGLWDAALEAVLPLMAADAWIYVEQPPAATVRLPPEWHRHREGGTRDTRYALYRRRPADGARGGAVATLEPVQDVALPPADAP